MEQNSFRALIIAVPTISVLVGILANNRQLESVRKELKAEIRAFEIKVEGLRGEMNARFESQRKVYCAWNK